MKVFVFATVLAAFVCVALAAPSGETETRDVETKNEETNVENAETVRTKKNAYQPAPAPAYKSAPAPAYKAAPAPAYHHAAPEYHQEVHAGPAKAYTYPSPAPKVKCPSSLLLSCQPNVAHVPCVSPPASYGHAAPAHYGGHAAPAHYGGHAAPAHYGHAAPAPHHY